MVDGVVVKGDDDAVVIVDPDVVVVMDDDDVEVSSGDTVVDGAASPTASSSIDGSSAPPMRITTREATSTQTAPFRVEMPSHPVGRMRLTSANISPTTPMKINKAAISRPIIGEHFANADRTGQPDRRPAGTDRRDLLSHRAVWAWCTGVAATRVTSVNPPSSIT